MNIGRRIISNVFFYFLNAVTMTTFSYLFWILMGKMLVPSEYGILLTITSLFYIISTITTLGFYEAIPKFVPEFLKKRKSKEVKALINFSLRAVSVFSLIVSIMIFLSSEFISLNVYGSIQMTVPLQLLSVILFTGSLAILLRGILIGLQRFKYLFYTELSGSVIKIVVAVSLAILGYGVLSGILGWTAWFVVITILSLFFIPKMSGKKNFDKKLFLNFGYISIVSTLSFYFILQIGVLLLGVLSTFESVAMFGAAYIIGQLVLFIPLMFMVSLLPTLSELWIKEKKKFKILLSLAIKAMIMLVLPLVIFLSIFSKTTLNLLYSTAYTEAAVIFPTYMFGSFLLGLNLLLLIALYSAYKAKTRALIFVSGTIINLALCLFLIPLYDITGAAIAFLTSQIFMLILSLLSVNKIVKLSFSRRSSLLIPLNVLFLVLLYLSKSFQSLWIKAISVLLIIMIYFVSLLYLRIISKSDKLIITHIPDRFKAKKIISKLINIF